MMMSSQNDITPEDLMGSGDAYCKPVQYENALVKFESMDPLKVDDGMSGKIIYAYTDEYGQAEATFQSVGAQEQNIDSAEIKVFVDHVGEDVVQINYLEVTAEEKTWPWCEDSDKWSNDPYTTNGAYDADTNNDLYISDSELLHYILRWFKNEITDFELIDAIRAWMNQL